MAVRPDTARLRYMVWVNGESGSWFVVGVNRFTEADDQPIGIHEVAPDVGGAAVQPPRRVEGHS